MNILSSYDLEQTLVEQEKINVEELFEKKQQQDLKQLECFQKILSKIHQTIRNTSIQKVNKRYCWFRVPEMILGVSCYKQSACIAYVMNKLKENNFFVAFYYPNSLFISWNHIVPEYIREEIKKKTQIEVDMFGNIVPPPSAESAPLPSAPGPDKKPKTTFRPIPPSNQPPLPY
jgi:hypothetical protein